MGCADIAQRLMIPAIQGLKDTISLLCIASRTTEKANEFAHKFNIEGVVGYDNLLDRNDIDAIYMPLPTGLHEEWIMKALKKGKHVYAEKSIAMHYRDAKRMVDLAKEKGLALMEGYMFQYHKQHELVKELISNGTIGDMRIIRASFGFPPLDKNNFRYDNQIGGGALKDTAGYVLRAVNFLNKNRFSVSSANIYYDDNGTSIYGSAFLKDTDRVSAEVSFGFDNFYQCNYEIWGNQGKLTCLKAFTPKPNESTRIIVEKQGNKQEFVCEPFNHFEAAMQEFVALCNNEADRTSHYDAILHQSKELDRMEELSKL